MYFTRIQIVTIWKKDSSNAEEVIVEQTEFAKPANVTSIKREALKYHEKLSDAISLITE